ncbi:MAG TPA: lysylphosphatidylglycerol synthase transmembrane domain-containing protein [Chitinophagaceae bacterium]|nr:lysylphosphatidylglycerol synthase transmembrane domain-containing protein [Chitinophagaceae bacterium]
MKKSILTILQYLFFLGLGIFFVWLTVKDIHHAQWLQIKAALARARHWLIIPALLFLFVAHYSRALRWKILMEPMGYKPSNFNVFAAVMIGYLVNAGVPRLGEVVKCSMLARYEKVRVDRLVGTIVMERAVDVVCLLLVFACALIFEGHIINEHIFAKVTSFFQDGSGHTSIQKVLVVLAIIIAAFGLLYFILKRFRHINAIAKIKTVFSGILHGLGSIRLIKHKGLFLFHTSFIWTLYLAATTVGIYALQETSHLGVGGGLTTLALGSVGMLIAPGGIGAYAWIVAKLVGWYGLDETTIGTALGWLLWSVQTMIILLGGLVFFALLSYHNKKRTQHALKQQHSAKAL